MARASEDGMRNNACNSNQTAELHYILYTLYCIQYVIYDIFELRNFSLGSLAWDLRFGISGWGNWALEAGGTAGRDPGEPGDPGYIPSALRNCIRTL